MADSIGVKQRNLSRVLRLVHREGPMPRSALTEATGLNRSTIAYLVGELRSLGLVTDHGAGSTSRVGRPSPIVAVDPRVVAIAVHPEVDALTLAAVALDRRIAVRERIEVDHLLAPEETARIVAERIDAWAASELREHRVVGVGLAVPGLVRARDGIVREAPHLRWRDAPLARLAHEATGLEAAVDNDATLGAMAEHLYGAGRGHDAIVYLNGGASGIGGGIVVGGCTARGAGGYAGEFGQNRPGIASDDDRRGGRLEDEVDRDRLLRAVGLPSADEPALAAAIARDPDGVSAELGRQRRILATALANAVNVLNPSIVILGGFLATILQSDPAGLRAAVAADAMAASMEDLEIRVAALGEDRLLIGAAEAAFARILDDPARDGLPR
ncbi:ROK family protein [Microbacterium sp. gxy059]|uniref:ROK family protein n=1 Tax=Microbacterium sp. gxy059 TaxID=2957199 RepID=UPI003D98BF0B